MSKVFSGMTHGTRDGNVMDSEIAFARTSVYALLALGFGYPDRRLFASIANGAFAEEMEAALAVCAGATVEAEAVAALRPDLSFEEFEAAYLRAFETDAPLPSVSLYQASYIPGLAKSDLLLELKAFYDNFGLAVAPHLHELEDKLTAELEIMQFLAAKQAQASGRPEATGPEGMTESPAPLRVEPYVLAQRDFLQRHLAVWLPKFNDAVTARDLPPFFRALAYIAAAFVVRDGEAMDEAARQLAA
ncbi:MAG: molecular chaperone TorD family protein [Magnetospirillum sp. WYHS-4]